MAEEIAEVCRFLSLSVKAKDERPAEAVLAPATKVPTTISVGLDE
jgi:hypothetical protein